MDWPEAGDPPNNNVVGVDPQLSDPKHGDFAPVPGSAAVGYGCRTFPSGSATFPGSSAFSGGSMSRDAGLVTWAGGENLLAQPTAGDGASSSGAKPAVEDAAAGSRSGAGRSSMTVSGAVTTDTVWDADTVRVVGDVSVEDGVTLSIAPGARVEFSDFYRLTVLGRLLAIGTHEAPITFTTDEPWAFAPDTTRSGCWNGIRFPWTSSLNDESRLEHCIVEHSKALGDEPWGGAVSIEGFSDLLIRNCILRDNAASYGGAVFCSHQAAPEIVGTLMEDNSAFLRGAAVYSLYSYPEITNCTIVGNDCLNDEIFDETGAVHSHIGKPRTTSSIVRDNTSTYFVPTEILRGKAFCTTFSNVGYGHDGEGNIDEVPLFVGSGEHPYALLPGSPCVNAGKPDSSGLRLPPVDVAGDERIQDGRIDMGAYEGWAGTGVEGGGADDGDADAASSLSLDAPNPVVGPAHVSFTTPGGRVSVRIYDLGGRMVRTLFDGAVAPGAQTVRWDCRDGDGRRVAAGVYFCRLECDGIGTGLKLVLLR